MVLMIAQNRTLLDTRSFIGLPLVFHWSSINPTDIVSPCATMTAESAADPVNQ